MERFTFAINESLNVFDLLTLPEPYESIWIRLGGTLSYVFQLGFSLVLFCFINYERKGLAGPYRTVINQLISYLYMNVRALKLPA